MIAAPTKFCVATATLSADGLYRYDLHRHWRPHAHDKPYVLWCLLNPSTADGATDDHTVRKAAGFSALWGYHRMVFVNLFAWRATQPEALTRVSDPIGPDNDHWIRTHASNAQQIVVAWGQNPVRGSARHLAVLRLLIAAKMDITHADRDLLYCLGHNVGGHPKHPLMLKYATPLNFYQYDAALETHLHAVAAP